MKFQSNDYAFLSTVFLFFLLTLVALWADFHFSSGHAQTQQIGTIFFKDKVAERKFSSQPLWNAVENGAALYNFDSVRTENGATAIIHLDGDTQVEIGPNSLILLSLQNNLADIKFSSGSISARNKSGKNQVHLSGDNLQAVLQKGDLNLVQNQDGSTTLDTDADLSSLQIDGKQVQLDKNQIVSFGNGQDIRVSDSSYLLQAPAPSASFVTTAARAKIDFSWQSQQSANTSQNLKVLVSTQADFSDINYSFSATGNSLTASLPQGFYYWKVSGQAGESTARKLMVFQDNVPTSLSPQNGSTIDYVSTLPLISFRWRATEHALAYRLQIFSDAAAQNQVQNLLSYAHSISTDTLPEGTYYWSVTSVYPNSVNKQREQTKKLYSFSVKKSSEIAKPVLLQGQKDLVVSQNSLNNKAAVLQWQDDPNVEYYTVEIAKDKDFKEVEVIEKTKYNYFAPPADLQKGEHYWRVRAHANASTEKISDNKKFLVKKEGSITNQTPPEKAKFFLKEDIYFSWYDIDKSKRYLLEFSREQNMDNVFYKQEVQRKSSIVLDNLPAETLYWRVSSLDQKGKVLVRGNVSPLNIAQRLPPLQLISPPEDSNVDFSYNDKLVCAWKSIKEARAYHIKVYAQVADVKNLIFDEIVYDNSFVMSGEDLPKFREIDYSWDVEAVRKSNNQYSQVSETALGHFTVILSEKLTLPQFKYNGTAFIYEE